MPSSWNDVGLIESRQTWDKTQDKRQWFGRIGTAPTWICWMWTYDVAPEPLSPETSWVLTIAKLRQHGWEIRGGVFRMLWAGYSLYLSYTTICLYIPLQYPPTESHTTSKAALPISATDKLLLSCRSWLVANFPPISKTWSLFCRSWGVTALSRN